MGTRIGLFDGLLVLVIVYRADAMLLAFRVRTHDTVCMYGVGLIKTS